MNASQIIDALGGSGHLAGLFGIGQPAVSNWKARGFPPSRIYDIHQVARRAKRRDITLAAIRAACEPPRRHPSQGA